MAGRKRLPMATEDKSTDVHMNPPTRDLNGTIWVRDRCEQLSPRANNVVQTKPLLVRFSKK
jgi:hypothetical protein